MNLDTLFIGVGALAVFIIGIVLGAILLWIFRGAIIGRRQRIAERKAFRIETEAQTKAKAILDEAKLESEKVKNTAETEYRQRRTELQRQENRLTQKIDSLDHKLENLEHRDRNLNNREKKSKTLEPAFRK